MDKYFAIFILTVSMLGIWYILDNCLDVYFRGRRLAILKNHRYWMCRFRKISSDIDSGYVSYEEIDKAIADLMDEFE